MKQLPLVKIDHPAIREHVRECLRGLKYRQMERDARRAKERARNRRRAKQREPAPTLYTECVHARLDENGICRACGKDCRGIG